LFQFIASYNCDFALATLPIELILLGAFCLRRNLPVASSRSFLAVMFFSLVMTFSDIYACVIIDSWQSYPAWLIYAVNIVYFLSFLIRSWALFDYTANECHSYETFGRHARVALTIPLLIMLLAVLSTPLTHLIFSVTAEEGYVSGTMYPSIYYCLYLYIGLSLLCVPAAHSSLTPRLAGSTLLYNAVLLAGVVIRRAWPYTLVMDYINTLAVLIIYLSAQNPDLFRNRKTGLFNRDAFDRIVSELLYQQAPFHCIVASANNYDSAKALYGPHQLGECLRVIGQWLIDEFPGYYVFYFRSGRFLLLYKGTFQDEREAVMDKLRAGLSSPWRTENSEVSLTISAMVLPSTSMPDDLSDVKELVFSSFDRAYEENTKGNLLITDDVLSELERQEAVRAALVRALAHRRIEVYLQPIYSAGDKRVVSAEALARLNDPELGFIPPDEFIRIAEQTGDIMALGDQIFERVCVLLQAGQLATVGVERINVNLSPAQCMNDRLAHEFSAIADSHGVSLSNVDFEITETSLEDFHLIQKQMVLLRESGATFALDDFGTGTSNITRLMQLPIDTVKLDMTVVSSYFSGDLAILPDLVNMFHNAGKQVVVEGVETAEMHSALEAMGCDYEQGYYFMRPSTPEEFVERLSANEAR